MGRVRAASVLLASLAFAALAQAGTRCDPASTAGVERCVSGLPPTLLARMQQNQEASRWGWAASVSMLLRRYGLSVPQEQVARAQLGRADNVAIRPEALAGLLNRKWQDDSGRALESSAAPLPTWRRHLGVEAPEVLRELDAGRPLVLAVGERAMLLVQLVYEQPEGGSGATGEGPRIVRAVVMDPASPQVLRSLRPSERQPDALLRVAVDHGADMHHAAHDIPPRPGEPMRGVAMVVY